MVRTGIPGYSGDPTGGGSDDDGGGSSSTTTPTSGSGISGESNFDSGGSSGGIGDRFDDNLGGDPVDSGGQNGDSGGSSGGSSSGGARTGALPDVDDLRTTVGGSSTTTTPTSGVESPGGSNFESPTVQPIDRSGGASTGGGSTTTTTTPSGGEQYDGFGDGASTIASSPFGRAAGAAADVVFGDGPGDGAAGSAANRLDRFADRYDRQVTQRVQNADSSNFAADAGSSPAPGVGFPVDGDFAQRQLGTVAGAANVPALARDALRTTEFGAAATRQIVADGSSPDTAKALADAGGDALRATPGAARNAAEAAAENPERTAATAAGIFATAGVGIGASRGARRGLGAAKRAFGDVDAEDVAGGAPDGSVATGRSDVGTGGTGTVLDADTVDAARGVTGPSRTSLVSGRAGRALDDARDRLDDSGVSDFVADERGQLQAPRGDSPGTDFGDAPDRTRPSGAGGTFEDVRQDSLTQTQDALRGQSTRPDPGDFERGSDPFGPGGGDVIDDDGVNLARSSGVGRTSSSTTTSSTGSSGIGWGVGLGTIAATNDPTGITPTGGSDVGAEDLIRGADSGGASTFGALDGVNDQTGIGTGTGTGAGNTPGNDTDTGIDTGIGSGTGNTPGNDTGGDTTQETATGVFADTIVDTTQDRTAASGSGAPQTTQPFGEPTTFGEPTRGGTGRAGSPTPGGPTRTPVPEFDAPDNDDDPAQLLFDEDADTFGSGIASADDVAPGLGGADAFRFEP